MGTACAVACGVCALTLLRLGYVVLHAEEVAELGKRNEELMADNLALDKENEEYAGVYCAVFMYVVLWVMLCLAYFPLQRRWLI